METAEQLEEFARDLTQEVLGRASLEGDEQLLPHAFTQFMIDTLAEAGEITDGEACPYRARGMEVHGYAVNDDEDELNLFVTIYRQLMATVHKGDVEIAFRRLRTFFDRARSQLHLEIEEASPAFDMALRISELHSLAKVRVFLLTDGTTTTEFIPDQDDDGIRFSFHVWDLRRTHRLITSGRRAEAIEIDFVKRFGSPLPCLKADEHGEEYAAYLLLIPGEVLADIYAQYGPRLLELNVRSFLQVRGNVNKGIRETIRNEPERFLAYNNGIAATASAVRVIEVPGGGNGIAWTKDLQIVNGGQTTASIHQAVHKDKHNVSSIRVQCKLTVIDDESIEEIVPRISKFANSQNKVSEADFYANDPFHVDLEGLSRAVWAPATDGTQRQTRWFYERARGQYQDAVGREPTSATKRRFRETHPRKQMFTKTDLAKFENSWDQLPHVVSLGAQKNFREFVLRLAKRGRFKVDQTFFQRVVAKAILFRSSERIISAQNFGGYRANIVTYSIAYLAHRTSHRVDFDRIWREQRLSETLEEVIAEICHVVHGILIDPPGGRNVTEWCKKAECWERVRAAPCDLSEALEAELLTTDRARRAPVDQGIDAPDQEEKELIRRLASIEAGVWFGLARWAKQVGALQGWQRGLAYSLGRRAAQGQPPTRKQAIQGHKIMEEANRLGFKPDEE